MTDRTKRRTDRPGYNYRDRADGTRAHYWKPGRAVKGAPPYLESRPIADGATDDEISKLCQAWTDELKVDLNSIETAPTFDGTISSVIHLYRTDLESPFHALKQTTRKRDYEPMLRLLDRTVGKRAIKVLTGADFRRWYKNWSADGKVHTAHNAIRKLRTVLSYGASERLAGCGQVREILSLMEFEAPAPRKMKLEYSHAQAIIAKAIEMGRPSIALTQAIQFETALRRIDIIGQWVPVQSKDEGGIVRGQTRWVGPTIAVVDGEMIMRIAATSKTKSEAAFDLKACPLVMQVIEAHPLPKLGPLIVSERTGLPYRENYYATEWREVARAAGVPDSIWSMDSRAGAISEAELATGNIDMARKLATHSDPKTTRRYVRNDLLESNRAVAEARSKHRR